MPIAERKSVVITPHVVNKVIEEGWRLREHPAYPELLWLARDLGPDFLSIDFFWI